MKLLSTVIAALISFTCMAAENYKCSITGAFTVNKEGKQDNTNSYSRVGQEFTVHRGTGIMAGALSNTSEHLRDASPTVVNKGSKENSFQVINTMRFPRATDTFSLTIEEYVEGKYKPFAYLNNANVYYGLCTHF